MKSGLVDIGVGGLADFYKDPTQRSLVTRSLDNNQISTQTHVHGRIQSYNHYIYKNILSRLDLDKQKTIYGRRCLFHHFHTFCVGM